MIKEGKSKDDEAASPKSIDDDLGVTRKQCGIKVTTCTHMGNFKNCAHQQLALHLNGRSHVPKMQINRETHTETDHCVPPGASQRQKRGPLPLNQNKTVEATVTRTPLLVSRYEVESPRTRHVYGRPNRNDSARTTIVDQTYPGERRNTAPVALATGYRILHIAKQPLR